MRSGWRKLNPRCPRQVVTGPRFRLANYAQRGGSHIVGFGWAGCVLVWCIPTLLVAEMGQLT